MIPILLSKQSENIFFPFFIKGHIIVIQFKEQIINQIIVG
jgi:hypothetical protein